MNESMRSVADIPGDDTVDDDLAGISPELVLIDPELARLVRERQAAETPSTALRPATLRLVEGGSDAAPIVPRAVEIVSPAPAAPNVNGAASSAAEPVIESPPSAPSASSIAPSAPEPVVEEPPEEIVPVASAAAPGLVVDEPVLDVLPIPAEAGSVARRVIEAEPARAVPPPKVEEPTPLVPDRLADITVPAPAPTAGYSTMPHPVARPATQRRARPSADRRKRGSARGVFAFLVAVAIAAAAVLGITRLTAGSSDSAPGKGGTAAVGAPPVATKSGKKKGAASAKKAAVKKQSSVPSKPKPAATKPAVTKPVATQKKSGTNASSKPKTATKPKTQATTKPKTQASAQPKTQATAKPKAQASSKPKPTASKPETAATPPKKTAAAPASGETRRFAWAPVAGAVGYHVELFRGNDRVLAQDTKEPVLELAPSWRYEGRTVTLTPGEYRWYVWPVTASGRGAEAVVQAKLTV